MNDEKTVTGVEITLPVVAAQSTDPPAQATTTTEQNLHTQSQRDTSMMWETTHRQISLIVIIATMAASMFVTVCNAAGWGGGNLQIPNIFSVGFGTVIGFYFARTNHQYVGGVKLGR